MARGKVLLFLLAFLQLSATKNISRVKDISSDPCSPHFEISDLVELEKTLEKFFKIAPDVHFIPKERSHVYVSEKGFPVYFVPIKKSSNFNTLFETHCKNPFNGSLFEPLTKYDMFLALGHLLSTNPKNKLVFRLLTDSKNAKIISKTFSYDLPPNAENVDLISVFIDKLEDPKVVPLLSESLVHSFIACNLENYHDARSTGHLKSLVSLAEQSSFKLFQTIQDQKNKPLKRNENDTCVKTAFLPDTFFSLDIHKVEKFQGPRARSRFFRYLVIMKDEIKTLNKFLHETYHGELEYDIDKKPKSIWSFLFNLDLHENDDYYVLMLIVSMICTSIIFGIIGCCVFVYKILTYRIVLYRAAGDRTTRA